MEREKGFEPSTLALARRCSTTELFPQNSCEVELYRSASGECQGLTTRPGALRSDSGSAVPLAPPPVGRGP